MTNAQTYKISEFVTSEWSDRKEYESEDVDFKHVLEQHLAEDEALIDHGYCSNESFYYFLHMRSECQFRYYTYACCGWQSAEYTKSPPTIIEPFMIIYGTTFDGVRETYGAAYGGGNIKEMGECLKWVHNDINNRWPRVGE